MDSKPLPNDIDECHLLIAKLQTQIGEQAGELEQQTSELSHKDKLIEEQAHRILQIKTDHDKLDKKVIELNLTIEKLLKQLYGRKSERRIDGEGQLMLDLGEEPTPAAL